MKGGAPIAATQGTLKPQRGDRVAKTPAWQRLLRLVLGSHALAWADQAVVSGTSFLALIMIGRWTDPSQLGAFAIGSSVLALMFAAQDSLITRPYSIQLHRPVGTPAEHAFSALALSFLLSLVAVCVLSAVALALSASSAYREWGEIVRALAQAMPLVLMREFARRFAFAQLRIFQVLMLDVSVAALNLAILIWLGFTGRLSAVTAFGALGISCGMGAIGWLCLARAEFAFRLGWVRATLKQSWSLGKWLFSGQLAIQSQGYTTYWLSTAIAGAAVTGIYTACMSIVAFANPLLFGFYNVLTPKYVRVFKDEGGAGLRRQAARDSLLLVAVMSAFSLFIVAVGEEVMQALYIGTEYQGHGHILTVLALAAAAAATGAPASIALASTERARAAAGVMALTAVLTVVLVWRLMSDWGLLGAAYGVLIAEVVGGLGRWTAFLTLSGPRPERATAAVGGSG